jgi:hypothetical protein
MKKPYSKEKLVKVKKIILECVEEVRASGIAITPRTWGITFRRNKWVSTGVYCCPGGAVCLMRKPKYCGIFASLARVLKVDLDFVDGFVSGIDDDNKTSSENPHLLQGWKLGQSIRAKVWKT